MNSYTYTCWDFEGLNLFFVCPFRPFTPFLLLPDSCSSCANRSSSVPAIHAPEPTNTPALHGVLPCWGPALHELHSLLPQVKQKRKPSRNKEILQQMHKAHQRTLSVMLKACATKNSLFSILFRETIPGYLGISQVLDYFR